MLVFGGRSLRTVKHLITKAFLPKPIFIHHAVPMCISKTSKVFEREIPMLEERYFPDIDTTSFFMHTDMKLLDQDPTNLVKFLNHQSSSTVTAYNHPAVANTDIISAYLAARHSPSSLKNLHAQAYALISKHAEMEGLQQVIGVLAEDVLSHFQESDPQGFSESVVAILSHATSRCPLSSHRILRLYEGLVMSNDGIPPPLNPDVVQRIAAATLMRPSAPIPPLETLAPALLSSGPQKPEEHENSTQLAFELLMKVMVVGEESYPRALSLFQELIQANRIPEQAQAHAGEQGGSFLALITSALVKACLLFGWHTKAADLLMEIFRDPQWFHAKSKAATEKDAQVITDLAFEVLRILLPSMSESEVQTSQRLIMALLPITSLDNPSGSQSPPVDIPHDILFAFYDSCYNCELIGSAAHVYHHLQSPQIRQHHDYPPPRHRALFWLLEHFASPGISSQEEKRRDLEGHLYLARSMVGDILRRKHPVPRMVRPRLVALAAARGFGLYARQLWELYTAEDNIDRDTVRGNAEVLVKLVKLLVREQERWDTINRRKSANVCSTTESSTGVLSPSLDTDQADSIPLPRDYRRFAKRVLASYIDTKVPLAMASQSDLNALARAQLSLGQYPESIDTLSALVERGGTPRTKDINVLLVGIARYLPGQAAQIIQDMLAHGVLPIASTFSTVIHEALRGKDTELTQSLVTKAHELGYGALTQKGLASLIRSAVTFEYTSNKEERLRQQLNVRWAMTTVTKIMRYRSKAKSRSDHVKDHAISVSVGMNCVRGSLKSMQPQFALQFWRLLVKDRVLWDDREQKYLRAWIARLIRHGWRERKLETNWVALVLEELRVPGVEADGPQVARRRARQPEIR